MWEDILCASPNFVIQLRCLAGGLDLCGEGPEGGGPDRCLRQPILGKASDVVLDGTIVAYKTPP